MTMYERKVKLSARQPEGDRNGLTQADVLEALTKGFQSEARHIAIVELVVEDQTTSTAGVVTNRVVLDRIEVVEGTNSEQAARILRETFTARQPEALPGMSGEDMEGRGNE